MKGENLACSRCVMDTTDKNIHFDADGVCHHCRSFYRYVLPNWHTNERGKSELLTITDNIKRHGQGKDFDCILGLSGGVDSSYLLHLAVKELGLRPLVFHVDGGWNSQVAVENIQSMVSRLGVELFTEVINWEEMKDFQLSYIKSGLSNIDVPQDHAFIATLYNFAEKYNIRYILNGGNYSTECVRNPMEWCYYGTDMRQINDLRSQFGTVELSTYPFSSVLRHKLYLKIIKQVHVIKPLNYFPYIKSDAVELLVGEYGWRPYPQKHFESRFTKFYEGYWLPRKFGFDTRKVQFSSLILTKQMTRSDAIDKLSFPALSDEQGRQDFEYVAMKLGLTVDELNFYFKAPNKSFRDYKNQEFMFVTGAKIMRALGLERSIKR